MWPADTHVNYDANVNTTVNKLRKALGDSSDKPLYVETIPRRGYCLLVQPEISNRAGNHALATSSPSQAEALSSNAGAFQFSRTDLWVILGAIGPILAGILIGAGFMKLWMSRAASVPTQSVALFVVRLLEQALL